MNKELFVFVRTAMIPADMLSRPRLHTKEQVEDIINKPAYTDRYTVCRLVPCSVSEEPVTVTKKVIV